MRPVNLVLAGIFFFVFPVLAQDTADQARVESNKTYISPQGRKIDKTTFKVPEGMEVVEINGVNAVLPKGSKATKEHGMIMLEDSSEYLGRKLADLDSRMEKIEATQAAQQKQLDEIGKKLGGD